MAKYSNDLYSQIKLQRNSMLKMSAYIYKKLLISHDVYVASVQAYLNDPDSKQNFEEAMDLHKRTDSVQPKSGFKQPLNRDERDQLLKAYASYLRLQDAYNDTEFKDSLTQEEREN